MFFTSFNIVGKYPRIHTVYTRKAVRGTAATHIHISEKQG
jgi:hypothetical protein